MQVDWISSVITDSNGNQTTSDFAGESHDLSQVPPIGGSVRSCQMENEKPLSDSAPCMSRSNTTLVYLPKARSADFISFGIISESSLQEQQGEDIKAAGISDAQLALIIITGITACMICWQAWETRKAAKAAELNAQAVIDAERAWVIAEVAPTARHFDDGWYRRVDSEWTRLSTAETFRGEHLKHGLKFINMGRTAAQVSGYAVHCGLFDWKRGILKIQVIHYNGDFNHTLGGSDVIEIPDEIIDVNEFVKDPAAGIDSFKNRMVVLVSVNYRHIFSHADVEEEVFRFVFNPRTMRMERRQATEADKKQSRDMTVQPPDGGGPVATATSS